MKRGVLFLVILLCLAGCQTAKKTSDTGVVYRFKKLEIPVIMEMLKAEQSAQKDSYKTYKGIAADTIIEESPNVKTVTSVVAMQGDGAVLYPQVSPDGAYVVYSMYDKRTNSMNLWKKDVGSNAKTRLTKGGYYDIYPTISNDGKYIYFSSNRAGNFNIWRIKLSGGAGLTRITSHRNNDYSPDVSPDGKTIVFHSYSLYDTQPQIWTCNIDGSMMTQLRVGTRPKWSNNGESVLFLTAGTKKGVTDVWTMTIEGTGTTQLTSGLDVSCADFSPTGQLVFAAKNNDAIKPNYDIWVNNTVITTNPSDDDFPMVTNDGKLFSAPTGGIAQIIGLPILWNFNGTASLKAMRPAWPSFVWKAARVTIQNSIAPRR